jgi:hypothetical protein
MSYKINPQVTLAGAPGLTDDSTKGFVVGSSWVDTTPNPDVLYICTSSAAGAATWVQVSPVTAHTALTALGWSASGHTGTVTSVATFDAGGAAQSVAATQDGTVLSRVGGALAWVALAATVSLTASVELIEYLDFGADALPEAATAVVEAGVIA